jgi:hypothetical protein
MSALVFVVEHGARVAKIDLSTKEDRLQPVFSETFLSRERASSVSINLTWVLL